MDWVDAQAILQDINFQSDITNLVDGQTIIYDADLDKWINRLPSVVTTYIESKSETDAAETLQNALDNNLTAGRTWMETLKLKGDFAFSTITIPSFTRLDLTEARLLQKSQTNNNFIRNSDTTNGNTNIEIVGGLIDGNRANQSAGGTEDGQSMIFFKFCSNVWIHHTTVQYGDFHNIRFTECPTDIKVTNIRSIEARHEHVSDHAWASAQDVCRGHIIANNYFENTVDGNTSIATVNISDCLVIGNYTYKTFGPSSGIAVNGLRSVVVGNTVIDASGVGIFLAQVNNPDVNTNDSVIANNVVINATSYGIAINGYPGSGIVFTGNRVHNGGGSQIAGIYCSLSQDCVISNNIVSNRGGNGIYVLGTTALPAKRINITGNICYNNGQAAGGANHQAGIQVLSLNASGDASYVNVTGNQCYDNQGTKTQLYGMRISNATNCLIANNDLRDNSTAGFNQSGTNTGLVIRDNLGWVTEAKGSATIGDGGTINHGLAATPTYVSVQASVASQMASVTTISATNFTVAIKTHDNLAGTTQTVYWRAEV